MPLPAFDYRSLTLRAVLMSAAVALSACGGGSGGSSTIPTTTTTATAPGVPTIGAATPGSGSASIAFTAPASNGGSAITSFSVSCAAGAAMQTGSGTASPVTVGSLADNTTYACSVRATNSAGTGAASGTVNVTPTATGGAISTASVLCPLSISTPVTVGNGDAFTSTASWTCSGTTRSLTGNGIPDHTTGVFPGAGNPNRISAQSVTFSARTNPVQTATGQQAMVVGYALNSVKFDPGTAGTCGGTETSASQCNLANGNGAWRIEALGQTAFNFGVDANNAHVQPNGQYHYHGMPTALLTAAGNTGQKMTLAGWASGGFPIYMRYGYSIASDAGSALKVMRGSFVMDTSPDSGRPSIAIAPMGSFQSDWNYSAGSGDLDECNGRVGVTPEFPNGIYHHYITDTYPFIGRCTKGG